MTQRTITRTEAAALGLLDWRGASSGYDLHQIAGRTVGFIWSPARSQLYAVLRRMAGDGLIEGRHVEQDDRPDKRIFRITSVGRAALRAWLDEPHPIAPEDHDGILLKVFFGGQRRAVRTQLRAYQERTEERLAAYQRMERAFDEDDAQARLQTLRLGIALCQARARWAQETLATLEPARVEA
jgi:DNA-binding PadR family transcriptional regulator